MTTVPDEDAVTPAGSPMAGSLADVDVRPVAALAEYRACVSLQAEVWGAEFDLVPASMLQVATYVGGLCLGAFTADGVLCGFVFGLTGVQDGVTVHWSHLLAVRESARNAGVGRRLKEHQRRVLASRGIPELRWSFDPTSVRNAHLNLERLGARVVRFVPDMYGTTESPLHHGLPTDRLVVALPTGAALPAQASEVRTSTHEPAQDARSRSVGASAPAEPDARPVLTPEPRAGDLVADRGALSPRLRLEVPADFPALLARDRARAMRWHAAMREHFLWAEEQGYAVTGVRVDASAARAYYLLDRT